MKFKGFAPPDKNKRQGPFSIIFQAWLLLVLGGCTWYLFTSGDAIKSAKGNNLIANNFGRPPKDSVTYKKVVHIDSVVIFTPLEKFEAEASDSLFNVLATRARFNGSVLVAHDGKIVYTHQFGYSDFKTKEILTDTSEFQLGSVSKQFTAVSIMMLKEKGLLDYDDSVVKYFPDFPYKGVTIRMLLDHRWAYRIICLPAAPNAPTKPH